MFFLQKYAYINIIMCNFAPECVNTNKLNIIISSKQTKTMKKLFFTLLLAAATLPGWAGTKYPDVMYAIGTATSTDWNFDSNSAKLYKTSNYIYQGFVNFDTEDGTLKFMTAFEWNKGQWGAINDGQEITTNTGNRTTYADDAVGDTDADKKFVFKLPIGLYLVTINATTAGSETITFTKWETNSVYEIGNLGQLKFFADRLNTDGVSLNAKLTADIGSAEGDKMEYAIGWHNGDEKSTDHKWYNGEFDGNYHTIYLNIDKRSNDNPNNQGLFGAITGGAYIHDVTVAGSVKGKSYVAGIVGSVRCNSGGGGTVNIFNCKNTAEITGSDGGTNTGGIVGVTMNYNGYCTTNISYCCNTGNVYGKSDSGLISGWIGNGSIKHTFASGTLQGAQGGNDKREFSRYKDCDFYANVTMTGSTETGGAKYFNPSEATYTISDAEKFLAIATMVNVGGLTSKNFTLNNDIDLNGKVFTPIGNDNYMYAGTFDGGTHRIKNLKIDNDKKEQGLFSVVCAGATIQNVILDASCSIKTTNTTYGNAAFVAAVKGTTTGNLTFQNCGNEATVIGKKNTAAFVGANKSSNKVNISLTNCYNTATIGDDTNGDEDAVIIGWNDGASLTATKFYNSGVIKHIEGDSRHRTLGRGNGSWNYSNCYNTLSDTEMSGKTNDYDINKVYSGELCVTLGSPFTQDLSQTEGHPTFGSKAVSAGKWFSNSNDVYYNLEDGNYTVYQLNLNEANTKYEVPANVSAKNVSMTRTISAGKWNTFCSPVAIAKSNFSAVKKLSGATQKGENYTMNFTDETAEYLEAGKPYMVQVETTINELSTTNVPVANAASASGPFNGLSFNGTFTNGNAPLGSFIISNNVFYLVDTDTNTDGISEVALKAFRGYITTTSSNNVKALTFDFDDDATGISLMKDGRSQMEDGAIYNVAGQRINKMQKGINIVNGKKILK